MPIVRINYDDKKVKDEILRDFVGAALEESMQIFDMTKDKYSVFVQPYSKFDFSTAQIEVEFIAGVHEFEVSDEETAKEMRDRYAEEHETAIKNWKQGRVDGAIISTVTAANWKVKWID